MLHLGVSTQRMRHAVRFIAGTLGAWFVLRTVLRHLRHRASIEFRPGSFVLVTGGTRGIGYAMARQFALRGVNVIISGTREASTAKALASLRAEFPAVEFRAVHFALEDTHGAVGAVAGAVAKVDLKGCVMNAGLEYLVETDRLHPDALVALLTANVVSEAAIYQTALRRMLAPPDDVQPRPGGFVFGMSSIMTFMDFMSFAPYASSRAFQSRLYELSGLRMQKERRDVHVAVVEVGPVATETLLSSPDMRQDPAEATAEVRQAQQIIKSAIDPDMFAAEVCRQVIDERRTYVLLGPLWRLFRLLYRLGFPVPVHRDPKIPLDEEVLKFCNKEYLASSALSS